MENKINYRINPFLYNKYENYIDSSISFAFFKFLACFCFLLPFSHGPFALRIKRKLTLQAGKPVLRYPLHAPLSNSSFCIQRRKVFEEGNDSFYSFYIIENAITLVG